MDFNRQLLKVEILLLLFQCFVTVLCFPIGNIDTPNNFASALNPFHRRRELPSIIPRHPADIPRVDFQKPLTEPFLLRGNEEIANTFNILTPPRIIKEQQNNEKDDTQNAIVFKEPTKEDYNTGIPIKKIEDNELSKDILMEIFAIENSTLGSTTDFDYSGTTDGYITTTDEDLLNRSAVSGAALSSLLGR